MVSWTTAKKVVSPADIERLACIGWTVLDAGGVTDVHWKTIGPQIKGVKLQSFKRGIWVITKKCKEAGEVEEEAVEGDEQAAADAGKTKADKGGKGGAKRKAAAAVDADDGEDGAGAKKKVTKRARKGKKGGEEEAAEDGGTLTPPVKTEAEDDDLLV